MKKKRPRDILQPLLTLQYFNGGQEEGYKTTTRIRSDETGQRIEKTTM